MFLLLVLSKTRQTKNSWRTLHPWWRLKSPSVSRIPTQWIPYQWIPCRWIPNRGGMWSPWRNQIPTQSKSLPLAKILNLKGLLREENLVQWLWVSAQHLGVRAQLRPHHRCPHHQCLAKRPSRRKRRWGPTWNSDWSRSGRAYCQKLPSSDFLIFWWYIVIKPSK